MTKFNKKIRKYLKDWTWDHEVAERALDAVASSAATVVLNQIITDGVDFDIEEWPNGKTVFYARVGPFYFYVDKSSLTEDEGYSDDSKRFIMAENIKLKMIED